MNKLLSAYLIRRSPNFSGTALVFLNLSSTSFISGIYRPIDCNSTPGHIKRVDTGSFLFEHKSSIIIMASATHTNGVSSPHPDKISSENQPPRVVLAGKTGRVLCVADIRGDCE